MEWRDTPDILKNDTYREFWVSWNDGVIAAGYGRFPGFRQIIAYQDPEPMSVSYISLTTGFNSVGSYEIHTIPGNIHLTIS